MIAKIGIYWEPRNKARPWVVRWYGDYDPDTGKQKRYGKAFKLKVEAEQFAAELTTAFKKGQQRDKPEETTLKEFCRDWLKAKKPDLRPATVQLYKLTIDRLCGYFKADRLLSKITPRTAAQFIAELKPLRRQTLSDWTRHKVLRNCKTMFQTAVDWQLIGQNPFKTVKGPKCVTRRWHYITPQQYSRLLDVAPSLRWKAFHSLGYTGGLRFGELFSLTWNDIDFETGEIRLRNRPATATMPPFYLKDDEARTVRLPKHTVDLLTEWHGKAPEGVPYVLLDEKQYQTLLAKWKEHQEEKKPWLNVHIVNNALREFKRHIRQADIKPDGTLSIHTLRKSCIQNWANTTNNPETVRVLAGHADIKTTMQFYCQADREQRAKAAAAIDALLEETDVKLTYGADLK